MKLDALKKALTEGTDWSKYSDKDLQFLADKFAVGPKYKPQPRKTHECGGCKKNTAYYKTFHDDTAMEETTLYCPECGWTKGNV
jgi:DNA-directed RNA polymerase subunit M/transcription elongation factor TFIIS